MRACSRTAPTYAFTCAPQSPSSRAESTPRASRSGGGEGGNQAADARVSVAQVKAITDIIMAVYLENQEILEKLDYMHLAACTANPEAELCSTFYAQPPPPPGMANAGVTLQIADEYLPMLQAQTPNPLEDCWVTPMEMSRNPEAANFLSAFIQQTATDSGVDPSQVIVAALSTDGDNVPGCNGNQNVVPPLPLTEDSSYIVHVTPDRAASLGSAEAWNDCFLDPAEIAANSNAEAWVTAFRVYRSEQLGIDIADVPVNGISMDSDNVPGCSGTLPSTFNVNVDSDYVASLGDTNGDGIIDPNEMAAGKMPSARRSIRTPNPHADRGRFARRS